MDTLFRSIQEHASLLALLEFLMKPCHIDSSRSVDHNSRYIILFTIPCFSQSTRTTANLRTLLGLLIVEEVPVQALIDCIQRTVGISVYLLDFAYNDCSLQGTRLLALLKRKSLLPKSPVTKESIVTRPYHLELDR
jgi:hypothetical protein